MQVKELQVKSALSSSSLYGLDYALNPYRGCIHQCVYCYSPDILKIERKNWQTVVYAKVNLPNILAKELKKLKKGIVGIGTTTDAYQKIEEKYKITEHCLELLLKYNFPISIQTKSSLVLRDLNLIKKFTKKDVGFTITTIDENARKRFEPKSSLTEEKLNALKILAENNIDTWVFIGPVLPFISENSLNELFEKLKEVKVKIVFCDKLRLKQNTWNCIKEVLEKQEIDKWENVIFGNEYFGKIERRIKELCLKNDIKFEEKIFSQ